MLQVRCGQCIIKNKAIYIKPLLEIVTSKLLNGVQTKKLRLGAFINMEARQKIKHPYIMMIKQYCSQSKNEINQTLRVFSFFTIFIVSCSQTELIPVTAESLGKKISSYKGDKAVLVNIWALWCAPCIEEFPMIVNFQKDTKDLEVIFVSADFKEQSRDVVKFLNH